MIRVIFKNHDNTIRVLNWEKREGKDLESLSHDFKAKSYEIMDYNNPKRKQNNNERRTA